MVIGSEPMFLRQQTNQLDLLKMKMKYTYARACLPNNLKPGS